MKKLGFLALLLSMITLTGIGCEPAKKDAGKKDAPKAGEPAKDAAPAAPAGDAAPAAPAAPAADAPK